MRRIINEYSDNNDLDFYFNADNINNQNLVLLIFEHFNTGKRKGLFDPLEFLNLIWKQYNLLIENLNTPITYINNLKNLPLSDLERHILYGFLLKWFGGYPVKGFDQKYETITLCIERLFLEYPENTSEKKICKRKSYNIKRFLTGGKLTHDTELVNEPSPIKFTEKKGEKANLVRLLNAMYEMQLVDCELVTKAEFMQLAGSFFGVDLSSYQKDLNQAYSRSLEKNVQIFERMKDKTQRLINMKQK